MSFKTYVLSSDVNLPVTVQVGSLFGKRRRDFVDVLRKRSGVVSSVHHELYVSCQVASGGDLVGVPVCTPLRSFGNRITWDDWIVLPIKYRDLTSASMLVVSIYEMCHCNGLCPYAPPPGVGGPHARPLGGGLVHFFDQSGTLCTGKQRVTLWPNVVGEFVYRHTRLYDEYVAHQKHSGGSNKEGTRSGSANGDNSGSAEEEKGEEGKMTVLEEQQQQLQQQTQQLTQEQKQQREGQISDQPDSFSCSPSRLEDAITEWDRKIHKFWQSDQMGDEWLDQLTLNTLDELRAWHEQTLQQSAEKLGFREPFTTPACSTIYAGRHECCVSLPSSTESRQYRALRQRALHTNTSVPLVLTLASPPFSHVVVFHQNPCNPKLPALAPFADKERIFVLNDPEMQRENPVEHKYIKLSRSMHSGLADRELKPKTSQRQELERVISSPSKHLSTEEKQLLWRFRYYLKSNERALTKFLRAVDWSDAAETKEAIGLLPEWAPIPISSALELLSAVFVHPEVRLYAVRMLKKADNDEISLFLLQLVQALRYEQGCPSPLSDFLCARAGQDFNLTNFLYWFLEVEKADERKSHMFAKLQKDFMTQLRSSGPTGEEWAGAIENQRRLIHELRGLKEQVSKRARKVDKQQEEMRSLLSEKGEFSFLRKFETGVRLPVRPEQTVVGVVGEKSIVFKSNLAPMLLHFTGAKYENYGDYRVIFKCGDDLRQDQLIMQMINLMDLLLKKVKLDLKLTPYRVLATSTDTGFVEYVPNSQNLSSVLKKYDNDISKFFERHNQRRQDLAPVLENFVRSCAGYCVITYLLGVGDRHLDNVLLTIRGHLFHIDFGFIFGKDPKPWPPPMKITKEMVRAMGGVKSSHYEQFQRLCCSAFNYLRKHAALIMNLLELMADANIESLADNSEKTLLAVQKKFRLDLTDEQADPFMLRLVNESVSALFPKFMEKVHKWAMYWK